MKYSLQTERSITFCEDEIARIKGLPVTDLRREQIKIFENRIAALELKMPKQTK